MTSKTKRQLGWLGLSVLLHAMVLVSLPRVHVAPPVSVPTVVELLQSPAAVSSSTSRSPRSRAAHVARPNVARDSQVLDARPDGDLAFAPSFKPSAVAPSLSVTPKFDSDGVPLDDPTSPWGSGGAEFSRVRDLGKFDKLYDLIDANVMYPSVLAYHQIEGTVNARLVLSQDGQCDWHHTHITSSSSHLKVYVLDVLNKVCARNLRSFARRESAANLDLSFKFAITEHDDAALKAREKKVVGNVFLFYRNSQQSIAEWHLGPFRGMFPVPYVALDFSWLQENYDSVVHSRDPLRKFKEHLTDERPDS